MPVSSGPVPPFPSGADPDEYDRLRRRVLWKMPSGLYVVGSTDQGERRNAMTLNWFSLKFWHSMPRLDAWLGPRMLSHFAGPRLSVRSL
jgi:hypothetical protein